MLKILLFTAIVWILFTLFRQQKAVNTSPPKTDKPEDMVSCVVCAVHLPKSEAIFSQNQYFCCEEHFMQRKK